MSLTNSEFAAIADAASLAGFTDPAQFEAAYDVLVLQEDDIILEENWETELGVISRMGMAAAIPVLETLKSAGEIAFGTDVIKRFIESARGVNLADPETVAFVQGLVGSGLDQSQADALLASNTVTVAKFPGLTRGQVSDALRMRERGDI